MKKLFVLLILVAIFLCNTCGFIDDARGELKIPESLSIDEYVDYIEIKEYKPEPVYYNIPLNKELQEFIWWECYNNEISETLFYAIINRESEFKQGVISYTNDHGISQINYNTFNWLNEKFFNNKLNINNQKDRIRASVFYLKYLKENWQAKNLCEEDIFYSTIICYHMGLSGGTKFIQKYGYDSDYLNEVVEYKTYLETQNKE